MKMVLISINQYIMKNNNILEKCDDNADCNSYQECKVYVNSAYGYCGGIQCKEGNFPLCA